MTLERLAELCVLAIPDLIGRLADLMTADPKTPGQNPHDQLNTTDTTGGTS